MAIAFSGENLIVAVALIIALWSPLADPARLAVADQVARLQREAVTAASFDFDFLRRSGRYGVEALRDMQSEWAGPEATAVRKAAAEALASPATAIRAAKVPPANAGRAGSPGQGFPRRHGPSRRPHSAGFVF